MMESLKDIKGIDSSAIKSFEDLETVLNDIVTKAGADADEKIRAIGEAMAQAAGKSVSFSDHINDASDSVKDMNRQAEDIENLKRQLLDFFSIGNAIQLFKRAVSSAFDTVKELDKTMTEAAVVTEFSVGDMW
ncbi:hypothetical protein IJD44_00640, partial [bacterium]|nr:hypothetical protein [bacterium]